MVFQQAQKAIRWFLRRLDTHPLSVTVGTVGIFTTAGLVSWQVMEYLEGPTTKDSQKQPMTMEEAKVRAMIENAQTSSWQENLDNAASAQQHFMLPGRPHGTPNFMMKIDKRSLEIMKEQHKELEKEKKRKPTTRIWN
jgi:hypothetical protein